MFIACRCEDPAFAGEGDEAIQIYNSRSYYMPKQYFVYMATNQRNTVLYTGITSDLFRIIKEHKSKQIKGFTKRYNIEKLVYYEIYNSQEQAILREKQIKAGSRKKKIDLIIKNNPDFNNLA